MSTVIPPSRSHSGLILAAAGAAIVLLGFAAYHRSFSGVLVFDDLSAVQQNPSIRRLWPLDAALSPPAGSTVAGRPLLNLTFAVNYALGDLNPAGYHAFNLGVHLLAGLVLFGLVRRTLLLPVLRDRFATPALPLAWAIAAIWVVHPVQTGSVTYISQRAESLMGLFYLLTLYAFVRRHDSLHPHRWDLLAVVACGLGAACKEVMMTAPVTVLLYDRTFIAGSFREAWRRHAMLYVGLAASWLMLAFQLPILRTNAVGLNLGVSGLSYALTECQVVVRYLGLAMWPHPLVFDYGEKIALPAPESVVFASVLTVLLIGTVGALVTRPVLGFLGSWSFVILAPTSSFVPIVHQPMAENRLYLPLVAVVALVTVALFQRVGRGAFFGAVLVLVLGFSTLTDQRNRIYQNEISLWRDTTIKRPENDRAFYNLGHALAQAHQPAEAVAAYDTALRLKPGYAEAHHNLGNVLAELGRTEEAVKHYQEALRLEPAYASAHYHLAIAFVEQGRFTEAIDHFEASLRLEPAAAGVHYNLGSTLARVGRNDEAIAHFAEAIRLSADYPEAHTNWGNVLAQAGYWNDAKTHYEAALKANPDYAEAHINLGNALLQEQRNDQAMREYFAALRSEPDSAAANYNLGNLLLAKSDLRGAISHFEAALRVQPTLTGAHHNLALALVQSGRPADALPHYEAALRLTPDSAIAHHNLSVALEKLGRITEAIAQDEAALRLQPSLNPARVHLNALRSR